MRITNGELLAAVPALRELIQHPIPIRACHRLARLAREVETLVADVEALRVKLVERYTARDEAGLPLPVFADGEERPGEVRLTDPAGFRAAIEELLGLDTEISAPALEVEELGEDTRLSAATFLALGPLLASRDDAEVTR